MKNFFQVKNAEESGKLESSDCLNLEAENVGGRCWFGVRIQSKPQE